MRDFLGIKFTNDECRKMYQVFLNSQKGNVDLRKVLLGILAVLKINTDAKLDLAFQVYDDKCNGYIDYYKFITIFSVRLVRMSYNFARSYRSTTDRWASSRGSTPSSPRRR